MIRNISTLESLVQKLRAEGKTIVTTNGCFDLLHLGHIDYLQKSKELAGTNGVLLVGVNSDQSITNLKGKPPHNSISARLKTLDALKAVDYVFEFDGQTPIEWLEVVKPDYHTKGKDYQVLGLPEEGMVKAHGGQCVLVSFIRSQKTYDTIKTFKEDYNNYDE